MSAQVAALCAGVAEAAQEALAWVGDPANAEKVGAEASPVTRQLRRAALRARKLGEAAARPMCVSVFGPSQAGKSFLVSVLARPENGQLTSNFPDPAGKLDFIKEINPEGEGESTGLVTRFTIHGYTAPPGFPVKLRLLSEADVARILINSFFWDGDKTEKEPDDEEFDALLKKFRGRAGPAPAPGFGPDDVIEIQEYVGKFTGRSTYAAALGSFWEEAIELAPRLSIADRAAFLSVTWGRHEAFTALYARLAAALEQLGGADEAFAGLDALTPRDDSIIDVKLLTGLDRDDGLTLTVTTAAGRKATLQKSVVTALTAELVMPMADKPHDLFEGTDLLDFPGARTRDEKPLAAFLKGGSGPLKECVLRGKVAYLFDRYVAQQEITAMLLCIPDSNVETGGLSNLVAEWVAGTHGATPEQRASVEMLLFFVLTKFDKHLIDSAGSGDDPRSRFDKRMRMSLLEKFGTMPDSWPKAWAPNRPFDNCFWLRNPNFPAESVITYENGREVALRPDKIARLTEMKDGCCGAELVRTHFRDAGVAWDAAMGLNDGGVQYLVDSLTPVCRPEMKARQIAAQAHEVAQRMIRLIARFHVSDDLTKRLEERKAAAQALMAELLTVHNHRLFGAMLRDMAVQPEPIFERMKRPPATLRLVATRAPQATVTTPGGAPGGVTLPGGVSLPGGVTLPGGPALAPAAQARPAPERMRTIARADWRAEAAFNIWVERLKGFAAADDLEHRLAIGANAASELAGELIQTARRLRLQEYIADELDRAAHLEQGDGGVMTAAILAAERLNAFTATASAAFTPVDKRPDVAVGEARRKPFDELKQIDDPLGLPALPRRADADALTDWLHMIYHAFVENAKDVGGSTADPEQNERLGAILKRLAAA